MFKFATVNACLFGWAGQKFHGTPKAGDIPIVRPGRGKGRFRTLLSACSNFANLNPVAAVMQRSVRVGVLYPDDSYVTSASVRVGVIV